MTPSSRFSMSFCDTRWRRSRAGCRIRGTVPNLQAGVDSGFCDPVRRHTSLGAVASKIPGKEGRGANRRIVRRRARHRLCHRAALSGARGGTQIRRRSHSLLCAPRLRRLLGTGAKVRGGQGDGLAFADVQSALGACLFLQLALDLRDAGQAQSRRLIRPNRPPRGHPDHDAPYL